ncbi:Response regulator rcp1 [Fibrisoma limi BUZ 3]|uniref:Response regulator rcp1 n=2 Tax=Fibrisoma limi TaxID=663275 RepID=I2GDM4_9BACT|nr:Response regulator rcp1 [Fibrisoma limi BUZ 3]
MLVVDDNPDDEALMQRLARRQLPDVQTYSVNSVAQALAYLDSCTVHELPRLILMDLYLPRREDGWQLLQLLKTHPLRHRLPVIVVSSSDEQEDIGRSYELGANSFITKPSCRAEWQVYFESLRQYWWDTVTVPPYRPF